MRRPWGTRKFHKFGCVVDGGTRRSGRKGWRCPRCAELDQDNYDENLLKLLDAFSGTR